MQLPGNPFIPMYDDDYFSLRRRLKFPTWGEGFFGSSG